MDRFNTQWYDKRIKQNQKINEFLIAKIEQHKDENFPWTKDNLIHLQSEDLFEIAIAVTNQECNIVLGHGQDFNNGWDAKLRVVRLHGCGQSYSAGVQCSNKKYLQILIYEPITEEFYFFAMPAKGKEIDIPFNLDGTPKLNDKWQWRCFDFETMANTPNYLKDFVGNTATA